jgi:hypothetical protein
VEPVVRRRPNHRPEKRWETKFPAGPCGVRSTPAQRQPPAWRFSRREARAEPGQAAFVCAVATLTRAAAAVRRTHVASRVPTARDDPARWLCDCEDEVTRDGRSGSWSPTRGNRKRGNHPCSSSSCLPGTAARPRPARARSVRRGRTNPRRHAGAVNAGRVQRHRLWRPTNSIEYRGSNPSSSINCCPRDGTPVTASSGFYFRESQSFWFWSLEDQIPHVRKGSCGGGMP